MIAAARRARAALHQIHDGFAVGRLVRGAISGGYDAEVDARLRARGDRFLTSLQRLVFTNPRSPYRSLLEVAGYDFGRVRGLVLAQGLDRALDQLQRDGVYVRIGEFKGTEPAVRGGRVFHFRERDFANPMGGHVLHIRTGGSRSHGTPVSISREDFLHYARQRLWLHEGYGLRARDVVLWITPLSGLETALTCALIGQPPLRWFSPVPPDGRIGGSLVAVARRVSGRPLPQLEVAPPDRVLEVARYIAHVNTSRGVLLEAFVNTALRLVLAAESAGIRLGDVAFMVAGEPLTPLKRRQFEERGFAVYTRFAFNEIGRISWGCPTRVVADDNHVMTDMIAVRTYQRAIEPQGAAIPAYLFTSLLPHARTVLLNTESGDYGGLEERACGCFLDQAGFRLHMHTIRSFEKLTAEGITFIGPRLIEVLDEVLPQRFGGDARHYQLVETEDAQGVTKLVLFVSPEVGPLDERALREAALEGLGARHLSRGYGRLIARMWDDAGTLQVLRREPLATPAGKVLHLHRDRGALRVGGEDGA